MANDQRRRSGGQGDGGTRRAGADPVPVPGRGTLAQRVVDAAPILDEAALAERHRIPEAAVVQRHGAGAALDDSEVKRVAAEGVAGGGTALPHQDAIQRSFGAHDVSGVRAHVGGAAAAASDALGAEAYATGSNVAFRESPSLFIAAHEAAHVVQQRGGVQFAGAVGRAGDRYEQHADAVAARVVAGESAEDLLGQRAAGAASGEVVQRKDKPGEGHEGGEHHAPEAPTHAEAGSSVIFAARAHLHLTTLRMYAVSSNIRNLIGTAANTDAGVEPIVQGIQHQFDAIMADLDRLHDELAKVPELLRDTLKPELEKFHGAWWDPRGLSGGLNKAFYFTHDKDLNPLPQFSSYTGTSTVAQARVYAIFTALGVDRSEVSAPGPDAADMNDLAGAVAAAGTEALDDGIRAVRTVTERLAADLGSPGSQKVEATELIVALSTVLASQKSIDATHVGPLVAVIKEVEALQAELAKRDDAASQAIAHKIGYNSVVSSSLFELKQHLATVGKKHR